MPTSGLALEDSRTHVDVVDAGVDDRARPGSVRRTVWWASALVLGATAALLAALLWRTGGTFVYVIDDPAIHLTVARRLAHDGTWGIVPGEFQAASSSPLWTLLLAPTQLVARGTLGELMPLALNVLVALWVVRLLGPDLHRALGPGRRAWRDVAVLAVVVVALLFLPGLIFYGMEHTLHLALVLATILAVERHWLRPPADDPRSDRDRLLPGAALTPPDGFAPRWGPATDVPVSAPQDGSGPRWGWAGHVPGSAPANGAGRPERRAWRAPGMVAPFALMALATLTRGESAFVAAGLAIGLLVVAGRPRRPAERRGPGRSGTAGPTGLAGAAEAAGPAGAAGPVGLAGAAETAGAIGPAGRAGAAGLARPGGAAGLAGRTRAAGFARTAELADTAGVAGAAEPARAAGAAGLAGPARAGGAVMPWGEAGRAGGWRGRLGPGVGLLVASASAFAVVAAVNLAFGQGLLPNSVLAKSFGDRGDTRRSVAAALDRLVTDPLLLALALVAVLVLVREWRRGRARQGAAPAAHTAMVFPAVVLLVATTLHVALASVEASLRYEAYLLGIGVLVLLRLLADLTAPAGVGVGAGDGLGTGVGVGAGAGPGPLPAGEPTAPGSAAPTRGRRLAGAVLLLMLVPAAWQVHRTLVVPREAGIMWEQRYQVARFLDRSYDTEPVAIGELGYIGLYHDGPLTDVYGLGDHEVLEATLDDRKGTGFWRELQARRGFPVLVTYDFSLAGQHPREWFLVATWRSPEAYYEVTQFWATTPDEVVPLRGHLEAFEAELPDGVEVEYNQWAPFAAGAEQQQQQP